MSADMQTMNISLPDPLKEFVDGQIAQGHYSSASEYVRELIRADEQRKARQALEAAQLEGLSSPRFDRQVAAMVGRRTWNGPPGRPRKETDFGEQGTLAL